MPVSYCHTQLEIEQQTNYPWDGKITLKIVKAPKDLQALFLRIPGWSQNASVSVNNAKINDKIISGSYLKLNQKWKKGDIIELNLPMPVELMEANPLVEEVKNQVAVKRGPLVYCLESDQLPAKISVNDVALNLKSKFATNNFTLSNRNLVSIDAEAIINSSNSSLFVKAVKNTLLSLVLISKQSLISLIRICFGLNIALSPLGC